MKVDMPLNKENNHFIIISAFGSQFLGQFLVCALTICQFIRITVACTIPSGGYY